MSILPEKRKCPRCGKSYPFNPAVGKIFCPYCKNDSSEMELTPPKRGSVGQIKFPDLPEKK